MIILGIDSSTPVAGVAIIQEQKILTEIFLNTGNTHSEKLLPMVKTALDQVGLTISEIDAIAFAKGPGSFTGLRIGMVTAKSLAQVINCKIIGVPTLDFLAFNLWGIDGLVCPILNARKKEVYTALYKMEGNKLKKITDYLAISPEKLAEILLKTDSQVTFLGDGVFIYKEFLTEKLGEKALWTSANNNLPRASSLALLALEGLEANKEDELFSVTPLYLRRSEAEINWEKKGCAR